MSRTPTQELVDIAPYYRDQGWMSGSLRTDLLVNAVSAKTALDMFYRLMQQPYLFVLSQPVKWGAYLMPGGWQWYTNGNDIRPDASVDDPVSWFDSYAVGSLVTTLAAGRGDNCVVDRAGAFAYLRRLPPGPMHDQFAHLCATKFSHTEARIVHPYDRAPTPWRVQRVRRRRRQPIGV